MDVLKVGHQLRAELEVLEINGVLKSMVEQPLLAKPNFQANPMFHGREGSAVVASFDVHLDLHAVIPVAVQQLLFGPRDPKIEWEQLVSAIFAGLVCTTKTAVGAPDEFGQKAFGNVLRFDALQRIKVLLLVGRIFWADVHRDLELGNLSFRMQAGKLCQVCRSGIMNGELPSLVRRWPDDAPRRAELLLGAHASK